MIKVQIVILCLFSVALVKPLHLLRKRSPLPTKSDYLDEDYGGNFEGDMILSPKQKMDLSRRSGLINTKYRWPNNIVPYQLSKDFTDEQAQFIRESMKIIESVSCLQFVARDFFHRDFIDITAKTPGCYSAVGYQSGGGQVFNLAPNKFGKGCFRIGSILHEFCHALGLYHMQSSSDRDNYVKIMWDNVKPKFYRNFRAYPESKITNFGTEYDYASVMHYPSKAFSKNGEPTIVTFDPTAKIGQRKGLSIGDIERLNRMYKCNENEKK